VPRGSDPRDTFHDRTRHAGELDAIADVLLACGARPLDTVTRQTAEPAPVLI
jgi:hypothetical protein